MAKPRPVSLGEQMDVMIMNLVLQCDMLIGGRTALFALRSDIATAKNHYVELHKTVRLEVARRLKLMSHETESEE